MLRVLISSTVCWVRLGHGVAHWCLRPVLMPPLARHQLARTAALLPYLLLVWGFTRAFDVTWRVDVIVALVTVSLLLAVHGVEVARAGN